MSLKDTVECENIFNIFRYNEVLHLNCVKTTRIYKIHCTLNKTKCKIRKKTEVEKDKQDNEYKPKIQHIRVKQNMVQKKKEAKEIYMSLCKGPSKLNPESTLISGLSGKNRYSSGLDFSGVMLANKYTGEENIDGWYLSEKLDGIRCYFDGTTMRTRNGNIIHPPYEFYEHFPLGVQLDGELWIGRNQFHECHSIVRSQDEDKGWYKVKYLVFDAPKYPGVFKERLEYLQKLLSEIDDSHIKLHEHRICKDVVDLNQEMEKIKKLGGEGVVLRDPNSLYEIKRSNGMLKVKEFHDDEATIIGYENGTGKYKDVLGAIIVKGANGAKFKVGSGFSDEQRNEKIIVGRKINGV